MLGNLHDFNPDVNSIAPSEMGELDRWALSRASEIIGKIVGAYESYEFHSVYHQVVNFCVVELSAMYFDILKDRLYTAGKDSRERRSSQTALWLILSSLVRAMAPILSFTAEEAWILMPQHAGKPPSVFLAEFPSVAAGSEWPKWKDTELEGNFTEIWRLRDVVLKTLEEARQAKTIGHPREARVELTADAAGLKALKKTREELNRLFLVSELGVREGSAVTATVHRASGAKCARCWTHDQTVGQSKGSPDICSRCVEAVS
jgi:isoleucyl-tRNA synthetase